MSNVELFTKNNMLKDCFSMCQSIGRVYSLGCGYGFCGCYFKLFICLSIYYVVKLCYNPLCCSRVDR